MQSQPHHTPTRQVTTPVSMRRQVKLFPLDKKIKPKHFNQTPFFKTYKEDEDSLPFSGLRNNRPERVSPEEVKIPWRE